MLSKEECKQALDSLRVFSLQNLNANLREVTKSNDVIEQLIKEHFELVKEYKDVRKELECYYEMFSKLKPYKFEDLKVGMWVYDSKREYEDYSFIKITKILSKEDCKHLYHDKNKKVFFDNMVCHAREFEENRFFPVQMANVIENKESEE